MISDNIQQNFHEAMATHLIITQDDIIADGQLRRFHIEGIKKGSRNGWYRLRTEPYATRRFGSWKLGVDEK